MGKLTTLSRQPIPLAELVIVAALFWGILCLNVTSDVLGNVVFSGHSFEDALRLVHVNEDLRQARDRLAPGASRNRLEGEGATSDLIADHAEKMLRQRQGEDWHGFETVQGTPVSFSART